VPILDSSTGRVSEGQKTNVRMATPRGDDVDPFVSYEVGAQRHARLSHFRVPQTQADRTQREPQ